MTLGLPGFGGASIRSQPLMGWRKTDDAWRCESLARRSSRSGRFLRGDQESAPSPGASLHPARSSRRCVRLLTGPFALQTSGRDIRHTLRQPGGLPFSSPPRRVAVSRCPARLVRPLTQPYHLRSEKTRDEDLKKHGDLDHQAHSLRVVGLGFTTSGVVMMTWARAKSRSSRPANHAERSGRYGVEPGRLVPLNEEELARPPGTVDAYLIDEIGKMECHCPQFISRWEGSLVDRSPRGDHRPRGGGFIAEVKQRPGRADRGGDSGQPANACRGRSLPGSSNSRLRRILLEIT